MGIPNKPYPFSSWDGLGMHIIKIVQVAWRRQVKNAQHMSQKNYEHFEPHHMVIILGWTWRPWISRSTCSSRIWRKLTFGYLPLIGEFELGICYQQIFTRKVNAIRINVLYHCNRTLVHLVFTPKQHRLEIDRHNGFSFLLLTCFFLNLKLIRSMLVFNIFSFFFLGYAWRNCKYQYVQK